MDENNRRSYFSIALISAIGGGLAVVLATKAIPKMMSKIMQGMLQNMMVSMRESGCDPADI
jgi:hypothetical protein